MLLGNGGPGYTIPAEFDSTLFHKKGVLAAARQGDDVNPKKPAAAASSILRREKYLLMLDWTP
jgi:peptidyl-prolyl cis-trans isomerase B (cyclophilin B)